MCDDVTLMTSTVKDMETRLNDLNKESKKGGLKVHKGKTKYMTNFKTDKTIKVEDQERVLGVQISGAIAQRRKH